MINRAMLKSPFRFVSHNMKLRHKLLLSYLLLIICPLGIVQYFMSIQYSKLFGDHIRFSVQNGYDQTYDFLTYKLTKITEVSDEISLNGTLLTVLKTSPRHYPLVNQLNDNEVLTNFLSSFEDGVDIVQAHLYIPNAFQYLHDGVRLLNYNHILNSRWFQKLKAYDGNILMLTPSEFPSTRYDAQQTLTAVHLIRNPNQLSDYLGVLRLDLNDSSLLNILSRANMTENSLTFLANSNLDLLASSSTTLFRKYHIDIKVLPINPYVPLNWYMTSVDHTPYLLFTRTIPGINVSMTTVIPYSDIISETNQLNNTILIIIIITGVLSYLAAYSIAHTLTSRLSRLQAKMKEARNESPIPLFMVDGTDEIADLMMDYNILIERVAVLMDEQLKFGKEIKNAEIRALSAEMTALQAQINPHFLYNTLDQVNWLAKQNMVPEITHLIQALANFYRLSLSNGKHTISIEDELKHVEYYVQIQNIRFQNNIYFHVLVDDDIKKSLIPKLTLQPIVENSILHGILKKANRTGTIIISAQILNTDIQLVIEDNGVGIPPETLDQLNKYGTRIDNSTFSGNRGYGLHNVSERLALRFGPLYGLTFEARMGGGTIVKILIPMVDPSHNDSRHNELNRGGLTDATY